MRFLVLIFVHILSGVAVAGEAGYLHNGKKVTVYKDGEKVGEYPDMEARKPNSISKGLSGGYLRYEEDELARCYIVVGSQKKVNNVNMPTPFCVSKPSFSQGLEKKALNVNQ